jgi:LPPG:FO 2-phospho-L-lactate transferase
MLCGGVGGARAALALAENFPAQELTFVVNTGDDFQHLGLTIWPDWDTVVYTVAGRIDGVRGWGRDDEGTRAMEELRRLNAPDWFHLGDRDLALHVYRTWALAQGREPAQVAADIVASFAVKARVLRVTEGALSTQFILCDGERMDFQTWFVKHQGRLPVQSVECRTGVKVSEGVLQAILSADLLLLAPSNPYLSIFPMLGVPEVGEAVKARQGPIWAVSPLLDGKAVKGPLDALISQLSSSRGQQAILDCYQPWVHRLLLPASEHSGLAAGRLGLVPCRTRLGTREQRAHFAQDLTRAWKEAVC